MTVLKISAATAIAMIGYAALASTANASASTELNKCRYDTKNKVVNCCERVLRDEGKPLWMIENGDSCRTAAVCFPGKKGYLKASLAGKPKCYIRFRFRDGGGNNPDVPNNQRQPRGLGITHGNF